jgi:hypothetical protein
VKESPEFLALGVDNFMTKAARELRDARLTGRPPVAFVHQAIRFRGKANYREALYLAHGATVNGEVRTFTQDMGDVLEAFLGMSAAFCSQRLDADLSREFLEDIEKYRSFSMSPKSVWGLPD